MTKDYRKNREQKLENFQTTVSMTPMEAKITILFAKSEIQELENQRIYNRGSLRSAAQVGFHSQDTQNTIIKANESIDRKLAKLYKELGEAEGVFYG